MVSSRYAKQLKSAHTDAYSEFTKMLIAARKNAGLTQQHLATLLSKPQSYISKYERGERRLDLIEFLCVAAILKIDTNSFISHLMPLTRSEVSANGD